MPAQNNAPETPSSFQTPSETVTGFCFTCRTKKAMSHATMTHLANGRWAFTGTCVTCGKKMYKISTALPPAE